MENSVRQCRQARLGIEPVTSRLPVLREVLLDHWWGPVAIGNLRVVTSFNMKTTPSAYAFNK